MNDEFNKVWLAAWPLGGMADELYEGVESMRDWSGGEWLADPSGLMSTIAH